MSVEDKHKATAREKPNEGYNGYVKWTKIWQNELGKMQQYKEIANAITPGLVPFNPNALPKVAKSNYSKAQEANNLIKRALTDPTYSWKQAYLDWVQWKGSCIWGDHFASETYCDGCRGHEGRLEKMQEDYERQQAEDFTQEL